MTLSPCTRIQVRSVGPTVEAQLIRHGRAVYTTRYYLPSLAGQAERDALDEAKRLGLITEGE